MCDANCSKAVLPNPEDYLFLGGCRFCDVECIGNFTGKFAGESVESARARLVEMDKLRAEAHKEARIKSMGVTVLDYKDPEASKLLKYFLKV